MEASPLFLLKILKNYQQMYTFLKSKIWKMLESIIGTKEQALKPDTWKSMGVR
jgi:hypothetical protein